jgi:hypothetical protein
MYFPLLQYCVSHISASLNPDLSLWHSQSTILFLESSPICYIPESISRQKAGPYWGYFSFFSNYNSVLLVVQYQEQLFHRFLSSYSFLLCSNFYLWLEYKCKSQTSYFIIAGNGILTSNGLVVILGHLLQSWKCFLKSLSFKLSHPFVNHNFTWYTKNFV